MRLIVYYILYCILIQSAASVKPIPRRRKAPTPYEEPLGLPILHHPLSEPDSNSLDSNLSVFTYTNSEEDAETGDEATKDLAKEASQSDSEFEESSSRSAEDTEIEDDYAPNATKRENDRKTEDSESSTYEGHKFRSKRDISRGKNMDENDVEQILKPDAEFAIFEKILKAPTFQQNAHYSGAFNRERARIIESSLNPLSKMLIRPISRWISVGQRAIGLGHFHTAFINLQKENRTIEYKEISADDADLFQWWDKGEMSFQDGLILVQDARVDWYQFIDDGTDITQIWSWSMVDPVEHIKLFQLDEEWKLLVVSESQQGFSNSKSTTLYGMDFLQNYWLAQRLPGDSSAVITRDSQHIITYSNSLSTVFVHKYNRKMKRYSLHQRITVTSTIYDISTFDIGYMTFLAIASEASMIYELREDFQKSEIRNFQLGHVEAFLPVLVDLYRDDSILLLQQKLPHQPHASIEALIWNGEFFASLEHAPCYVNKQQTYGLGCIAEETNQIGLVGAAAICDGNGSITIITTKMFDLWSDIVPTPNPTQERMAKILNRMKELKNIYMDQEQEFKELNLAANGAAPIIGTHWHIKELRVPFIHFEGHINDSLMRDSKFYINDQAISSNIEKTILFYQNTLNDHIKRIENASKKFKSAIKKNNFNNILNSTLKINGNLKAKGKIAIKNAFIKEINDIDVNEALQTSAKLTSLTARNIHAKFVNGKPWDQFLQNVIFTHENYTLDELEINELSTENLNINKLNEIPFPEGYVLKNDRKVIRMNGKTFKNGIQVLAVDCIGEINGIKPSEIVTLSTKQDVGNMTFANLTITDELDVRGKVNGRSLESMMANPSLINNSIVMSNIIFRDVKVNGTIYVNNARNSCKMKEVQNNSFKTPVNIEYVTSNNDHYLLVKDFATNKTIIWKWKKEKEIFVDDINHAGMIDELLLNLNNDDDKQKVIGDPPKNIKKLKYMKIGKTTYIVISTLINFSIVKLIASEGEPEIC